MRSRDRRTWTSLRQKNQEVKQNIPGSCLGKTVNESY